MDRLPWGSERRSNGACAPRSSLRRELEDEGLKALEEFYATERRGKMTEYLDQDVDALHAVAHQHVRVFRNPVERSYHLPKRGARTRELRTTTIPTHTKSSAPTSFQRALQILQQFHTN